MLHNGQKFPKNASLDNISGKYQNTLKLKMVKIQGKYSSETFFLPFYPE